MTVANCYVSGTEAGTRVYNGVQSYSTSSALLQLVCVHTHTFIYFNGRQIIYTQVKYRLYSARNEIMYFYTE